MEVPVFAKVVQNNNRVVYSPLKAHYAFYITKFIELEVNNDNFWDMISRHADTDVLDVYKSTSAGNGFISYLN